MRVVEGVDGDHDVGEGRDEDEVPEEEQGVQPARVPWHERSEESRRKNAARCKRYRESREQSPARNYT